jgi:hypothetical protein
LSVFCFDSGLTNTKRRQQQHTKEKPEEKTEKLFRFFFARFSQVERANNSKSRGDKFIKITLPNGAGRNWVANY